MQRSGSSAHDGELPQPKEKKYCCRAEGDRQRRGSQKNRRQVASPLWEAHLVEAAADTADEDCDAADSGGAQDSCRDPSDRAARPETLDAEGTQRSRPAKKNDGGGSCVVHDDENQAAAVA